MYLGLSALSDPELQLGGRDSTRASPELWKKLLSISLRSCNNITVPHLFPSQCSAELRTWCYALRGNLRTVNCLFQQSEEELLSEMRACAHSINHSFLIATAHKSSTYQELLRMECHRGAVQVDVSLKTDGNQVCICR